MSEEASERDTPREPRRRERHGGYHGPQSWVGDLSGRRAALTPDRVGLVDATTGRAFTYADLDARAGRTARWLDEHGVCADDSSPDAAGGRVAVVSRNRPELVDLFFGTGKTGGVLAPLSHRLAPPELAELLSNVDPSLVVVEEPFADDVDEALAHDAWTGDCPVRSLAVDGEHSWPAVSVEIPADGDSYEGTDVAPGDSHLLLHTGGSTGIPKETVITHEAICWNSMNTVAAWGLRPDDVTPLTFPMFHTGGWNVITVPLFHIGGAVVIAREVVEPLRERGAAAVGRVRQVDVDARRLEDSDGRLPHLGMRVVRVRVNEQDDLPVRVGGRHPWPSLAEPVVDGLTVEGR